MESEIAQAKPATPTLAPVAAALVQLVTAIPISPDDRAKLVDGLLQVIGRRRVRVQVGEVRT